jgi:catechol 2,3-dioxygenase-like lactoylglutathione lyase family enzyme
MTMLDHVGFAVADYKRSKAFYERALAPLGFTLLMEFSGAAAGFGKDDGGDRRSSSMPTVSLRGGGFTLR